MKPKPSAAPVERELPDVEINGFINLLQRDGSGVFDE